MSDETITQQVSERYARAVTSGEQMCCPTGYNFDDLRSFVPEEVLRVSYGCGTPAGLATVRPGETVLDIGSGGGIDCFEASRRVGQTGRVIGVDMTDEMLAMARRNAPIVMANLGYPAPNVEFRKGHAENLPVEDGGIDLIISNCVINLAPDKANCLSGALPVWEYLRGLVQAGFLGVHQMKYSPWSVIDGIHFVSLTLTGYKLPNAVEPNEVGYVTLVGPFSRAADELGQTYHRGKPEPVSARTAQLLKPPPFERLFLLSDQPVSHDHHVYRRGIPLEICSKTLDVLESGPYSRHFAVINRATEAVAGEAVSCEPGGSCC